MKDKGKIFSGFGNKLNSGKTFTLTNLVGYLSHQEAEPDTVKGASQAMPIMSPEDRAIIAAFAGGDTAKREDAIAIHRKWIPVIGCRGTIEQDFMAEVDNPCPDLVLRARYCKALLAGESTNATKKVLCLGSTGTGKTNGANVFFKK